MENKIEKKVPDSFVEYDGEEIMSNFDHEICLETANYIKGKEIFSRYAGWNFNGRVWWEENMWHCAVYCYGSHRETFSSKELSDIMDDVSWEYGYD